MKTTMKKALSLILTAAMLLSVALTATVATSAEDSNEKFNAYIEYPGAKSITSAYRGIVVDGNRTAGTEYSSDPWGGSYLAVANLNPDGGLYWGISYSGTETYNDSVKPNEVHMNMFGAGGESIQIIEFSTSGNTYVINQSQSSSWMWTSTEYTDVHPQTCYFKKFTSNSGYYEWALPMSVLNLEKVYDETDYSTDFSIKVTTDQGVFTKTGRLVLNDELHPNDSNVRDYVGKEYTLVSDSTLASTVNGEVRDSVTGAKHYGTASVAWEYNMDLTIDKMPDIGTDNLLLSYSSSQSDGTTPHLAFYWTNATATGTGRSLAVGIYNRAGALYIASPMNSSNSSSNEVALGVSPSETAFALKIVWLTNGNYIVYVNGVNKGTVTTGKTCTNYSSNPYLNRANLQGGTNYNNKEQSVRIQNYTVKPSYYGVEEAIVANSATPNYVPAIKFYQTSDVDNGTYNVRLIATVDKALVDAGDMTVAGFNVAASKTNGEGTENGNTKAHKVYEVYTSITASGETVNAPEGTYFMVFTIKNIPVADTLTLNFSAFAETETAAYVEGSVFTLTFENGERKN